MSTKSSLILQLSYAQRRSMSRNVKRNERSYDAEVSGFLLVKSWSLERNAKVLLEILVNPILVGGGAKMPPL